MMLSRGFPVEMDSISTKAIMFVSPPTRNKLWKPTYLNVNASEFVPRSQSDQRPLTSLNANAPTFVPESQMLSRGCPVEIDSNETHAIMNVNQPTRSKLWKPTYWDVNASEFVPRSQSDQRPLTSLNANAPVFVPGPQMLSRGYTVETDSNSTNANMYVNQPTRSKLWKPTYWDVDASEFVPRSQSDQRPLTSLNANAPVFVPGSQMLSRGYTVETDSNSTNANMYVNQPTRSKLWKPTYWDVDASEFVPRSQSDQRPLTSLNANAPIFVPGSQWDMNVLEVVPCPQTDSGLNSWSSSTPSSDCDEKVDTVEHLCVRCDRKFEMTHDGDYLREESCVYHWGRVAGNKFECCSEYVGANGCTTSRFHVWSGTKPGMNGPLDGYVRARHRRGGAYALDAEMCYTTAGLELASIVFIAIDGHIVYKEYVKPTSPVVDYNTRFSGIRPHHLETATKTLKDVQNDILGFVGTDTILIGHALENDLKALKLLHNAVVDTSDLYPHPRGLPLRRSLRALSIEILGRPVKDRRSGGHSPVEDARTALDLVFVLIDRDRATAKQKMVHRDRATAKQKLIHRNRLTAQHKMMHRSRTPTYRTSMVRRNGATTYRTVMVYINLTTAYQNVTSASNKLSLVQRL
ncbi:unnamed protein product [Diatraea saccharalis]|uniref:Exonuclease domain-containing protein n=1 Tax=Diatraea saccharalis TaxID=40085 RepID=A0A9N9WA21_9NEOP|nr:unnamed protein product [Diatraea saccharalis]